MRLFMLLLLLAGLAHPAAPPVVASKVILDTDIGDDIDDAYALGFLLRSPEVQVLGVTVALQRTRICAPGSRRGS